MSGLKRQRVISVIAISLIGFIGLESLIYINNLYQQFIYIRLAVALYILLVVWLYFLFDLHFKVTGLGRLGIARAFRRRFDYLFSWKRFRHFQNYLILPGIIYWGTVIIIGINFGHKQLQQYVAVFSSVALIVVFSLFKEVFHSKRMPINNNHFLILSYIKVYAAWLLYSAALGISWYYCLPEALFYSVSFFATLALLYQALFQSSQITARNVFFALCVSAAVSFASYFVYHFWNVNYFSAGIFLAAIYNFLWGNTFLLASKNLTRQAFLEQLVILIIIMSFVLGITDFRARIERC